MRRIALAILTASFPATYSLGSHAAEQYLRCDSRGVTTIGGQTALSGTVYYFYIDNENHGVFNQKHERFDVRIFTDLTIYIIYNGTSIVIDRAAQTIATYSVFKGGVTDIESGSCRKEVTS